jgi:hypothetical protein
MGEERKRDLFRLRFVEFVKDGVYKLDHDPVRFVEALCVSKILAFVPI